MHNFIQDCGNTGGPFNQNELTLIPTCLSNYIHYKMWEDIIYQLPNSHRLKIDNQYLISTHT